MIGRALFAYYEKNEENLDLFSFDNAARVLVMFSSFPFYSIRDIPSILMCPVGKICRKQKTHKIYLNSLAEWMFEWHNAKLDHSSRYSWLQDDDSPLRVCLARASVGDELLFSFKIDLIRWSILIICKIFYYSISAVDTCLSDSTFRWSQASCDSQPIWLRAKLCRSIENFDCASWACVTFWPTE